MHKDYIFIILKPWRGFMWRRKRTVEEVEEGEERENERRIRKIFFFSVMCLSQGMRAVRRRERESERPDKARRVTSSQKIYYNSSASAHHLNTHTMPPVQPDDRRRLIQRRAMLYLPALKALFFYLWRNTVTVPGRKRKRAKREGGSESKIMENPISTHGMQGFIFVFVFVFENSRIGLLMCCLYRRFQDQHKTMNHTSSPFLMPVRFIIPRGIHLHINNYGFQLHLKLWWTW